ncbi:hypothetical protein [Halodesulfurarchaeum formicicum]|uniref:hypothetical protein n=1 Tax=Halodesulfurarchaeum formicicum TaxID=1873524 RepID=UPI00090445A9|nr:hypothetical protein [Halodesulfurarchaeum formicicum]
MSLRHSTYNGHKKGTVLEACPACGYEFDENEDRDHHISTHVPSDFGLTPLGETAEGQQPLFDPIDEIPETEVSKA